MLEKGDFQKKFFDQNPFLGDDFVEIFCAKILSSRVILGGVESFSL